MGKSLILNNKSINAGFKNTLFLNLLFDNIKLLN